jgi:hypothetical protein
MHIEKSPFLKLDKASVIGHLKAAGSRDPDVLHAQKSTLLSAARFPKLAGVYIMVVGGLMTLLIITAFIGLPLLGFGWWMRKRGVRNIDAVEAGFADYLGAAKVA